MAHDGGMVDAQVGDRRFGPEFVEAMRAKYARTRPVDRPFSYLVATEDEYAGCACGRSPRPRLTRSWSYPGLAAMRRTSTSRGEKLLSVSRRPPSNMAWSAGLFRSGRPMSEHNSSDTGVSVPRRPRSSVVAVALAGIATVATMTAAACGASHDSGAPATGVSVSVSLSDTAGIADEARVFDTVVKQNCPGGASGSACYEHVKDLAIGFRTFRINIKPHEADPALKPAVTLADQGAQYLGRDYADLAVQRELLSLADQLDSWFAVHVSGVTGQDPSVPSPHPTS